MTAPALADPGLQAVADMQRSSTFALHSGFGIEPKFFKKDNGSHVYEGVAVFRSGTFADSMGYENTWEKIHLDQMISNWDHLKNSNTFANVPVRDGHPGWIISGQAGNGKVVGWHTNLRVEEMTAPHDGEKYHYLIADYEILDEDAQKNIASGLWRNRSSEIGGYRTNNQAEHWPVYMGVAYVDIPAVEGLNFSASKVGANTPKVYVMFDNKEKNVGDTPPAAPAQGGQPAAAPAAGTQHGAPAAPAFKFKINGGESVDFSAVQAHIDSLELFRSETTKANRENYVTALAAANKIPAPKLDEFKKHVGGMTPEQFSGFQELYGEAEVPALLGNHEAPSTGQGQGQTGPVNHSADASGSEVMILREQVGMHKAAGTSNSAIEKMESYKRLKTLDPTYKL